MSLCLYIVHNGFAPWSLELSIVSLLFTIYTHLSVVGLVCSGMLLCCVFVSEEGSTTCLMGAMQGLTLFLMLYQYFGETVRAQLWTISRTARSMQMRGLGRELRRLAELGRDQQLQQQAS